MHLKQSNNHDRVKQTMEILESVQIFLKFHYLLLNPIPGGYFMYVGRGVVQLIFANLALLKISRELNFEKLSLTRDFAGIIFRKSAIFKDFGE